MAGSVVDSVNSFLDASFADATVFGIHFDGHFLIEAVLVLAIVFLLTQKSYQPEKRPLTEHEIDQLCDDWAPEPLHPPITKDMETITPILESTAGTHTVVNGKGVLNLCSLNYLGMLGHPKIKETCEAAVRKYGVGSCGPRGFYGTIDVHLHLESKIGQFLGTPDSILYSYGLATVPSVIPAFSKRGDLIIADEGVHWGFQNGLSLSRSTIKYFKHNDVKDLERLLKDVNQEDKRKKKALNRRFIVVEAIYQNSGEMAPLDDIIRLKEKYRFRVLVDESNSLGVLGKTGRGITEYFEIPVEKVDILTAAMGHALASVGGFCTGSFKVVDHQRLSGAGYCYSASLPPYLASGSIAAIEILEDSPDLTLKLQANVAVFRKRLSQIAGLVVGGHPRSPLIFLYLENSSSAKDTQRVLQKIVDEMLERESVLMTLGKRSQLDSCKLPVGIRLAVSAGHTEEELLEVGNSLEVVVKSILS